MRALLLVEGSKHRGALQARQQAGGILTTYSTVAGQNQTTLHMEGLKYIKITPLTCHSGCVGSYGIYFI